MRRMLIEYRTSPEVAEENSRLVADVFRELQAASPAGLRYARYVVDGAEIVTLA